MSEPPDAQHYFNGLYQESDDPWLLRDRWYERRKRALTLAALPDARYPRAFEPGCASGELSAALAQRCDALLAADLSPQAVELARRRLDRYTHVEVRRIAVPDHWPEGSFGLIVLSELGYYLDPGQLMRLAARARQSLAPGGTVLACHWRRFIDGWPHCGDDVHFILADALALPRLSHYHDDDMVLEVWSSDAASVHQREGC
jgi:SAM-dependent methyltransferase